MSLIEFTRSIKFEAVINQQLLFITVKTTSGNLCDLLQMSFV